MYDIFWEKKRHKNNQHLYSTENRKGVILENDRTNEIDNVLVQEKFLNAILNLRSYKKANMNLDHYLK